MRLDAVLADIAGCSDMGELHQKMSLIAQNFGFASYNFLDIGDPTADEPFYIGSVAKEWQDAYKANDFALVDPCLLNARKTNLPFSWGSVPLPSYTSGRKPAALRLFEAARDFRYTEGFVVPFHFRDPVGRACSALVVFMWADTVAKFAFMISERRHDLHIISLYWANRAVELARNNSAALKFLARASEVNEAVRLTDRERAVLTWAGRGKTVPETADILGISENTVETYFKAIHAKLFTTNKTHAVVKAIYMNEIDL